MGKLAISGQPSGQPPRPHPPPKPQGHIVTLRSHPPELGAPGKKTRSLSIPHENSPGLAIHIPESLSRNSSEQSRVYRQQEEALQQLQTLRLELLGERKQLQNLSRQQEQNSTPQQTPGVAIPLQSPYYSVYSGAGELLKSPMSCMSTDQMLSQVNDDEIDQRQDQMQNEKNDINRVANEQASAAIYRISLSLAPSNNTSSSRVQSLTSQQKRDVVTGVGETESSSPPTPPSFSPQPPEVTTTIFDIQKNLEKQLAKLPGSRPPGPLGSGKSFDNHSYIISSGTKSLDSRSKTSSQARRLDEMVSIVPCDSYTPTVPHSIDPSNNVIEIRCKSKSKRHRAKRPPPEERCDTVKIDNGLSCVDPNNLKPVMQEILQKKHRQHRRLEQVGMIVEAKDLVEHQKRKSKMGFGAKLKDMFHDTSVSLARISPRRTRPGFDGRSKTSSKMRGTVDKHLDEKSWQKKTIEQENYKITKVLGPNNGSSHGSTNSPPIEHATSGVLSEEKSASESSGSVKPCQNMEIVMAAEGKNPMYRVPRGHIQASSPQQNQKPTGLAEAILRRQKQKELLAAIAKKHTDQGKEVVSPPKGSKQEEIERKIERKESLRKAGLDGSFCLDNSPSLESMNTYRISEVVNMFAQDSETKKLLLTDAKDLVSCTNDIVVSEKEVKRNKTDALRDAKIALLFSLKHKIVRELKKQKLKEHEAALRGEIIPEGDKEKALNEVRQLHIRREALRQLSEDDILLAFNKKMLAAKDESNGENTTDEPEVDADDHNSVVSHEIDKRKSVTFTSQPEPPTRASSALPMSIPLSRMSSWAPCGASAVHCVEDNTLHWERSQISPAALAKNAPLHELGTAAFKTVDLVARDSFIKAQQQVDGMNNHNLACALPKDLLSDDSSDESDFSYSNASNNKRRHDRRRQREQRTAKPTTTTSHNNKDNKKDNSKDRLAIVMSHSGSLLSGKGGSRGSFETRDTRDTRRTDYTEETRDTYNTRGTYDTRDSYATFDSRDSYISRQAGGHGCRGLTVPLLPPLPPRSHGTLRKPPPSPKRGGRRFDAHSVAGTEYTEASTYEEDLKELITGCQGMWEPHACR